MTKKKKIIMIAAVVVLGVAYEAKGMLMPPPKVHDKIAGTIYVLPKEFLVNLIDGRYGKVTVALLLAPGQATTGAAPADAAAPTVEGFGTLPEEAAVRDIITNVLTNQIGSALTSADGRDKIKRKILLALKTRTDVKVTDVMFTDVAVQ
jgi:flagellar basal body-associated protein FliL